MVDASADAQLGTSDDPDDQLAIQRAVESAFGPGTYSLVTESMSGLEDCQGADDREPTVADSKSNIPQCNTCSSSQSAQVNSSHERLLLFELDGTVLSVPVANVTEIQQVPEITSLPRSPNWLRGIANLRGSITSIVDLRCFLDIERIERDHYVVVVRSVTGPTMTGLLASRVLGFQSLSFDDVSSPDDGSRDHCVTGLATLQERTVAVLDVERIFKSTNASAFGYTSIKSE